VTALVFITSGLERRAVHVCYFLKLILRGKPRKFGRMSLSGLDRMELDLDDDSSFDRAYEDFEYWRDNEAYEIYLHDIERRDNDVYEDWRDNDVSVCDDTSDDASFGSGSAQPREEVAANKRVEEPDVRHECCDLLWFSDGIGKLRHPRTGDPRWGKYPTPAIGLDEKQQLSMPTERGPKIPPVQIHSSIDRLDPCEYKLCMHRGIHDVTIRLREPEGVFFFIDWTALRCFYMDHVRSADTTSTGWAQRATEWQKMVGYFVVTYGSIPEEIYFALDGTDAMMYKFRQSSGFVARNAPAGTYLLARVLNDSTDSLDPSSLTFDRTDTRSSKFYDIVRHVRDAADPAVPVRIRDHSTEQVHSSGYFAAPHDAASLDSQVTELEVADGVSFKVVSWPYSSSTVTEAYGVLMGPIATELLLSFQYYVGKRGIRSSNLSVVDVSGWPREVGRVTNLVLM